MFPIAGITRNPSRKLSSELVQGPFGRPLAELGYCLPTTPAFLLVKYL